MKDTSPRLSVVEKIGYGFGDFASNLFWQMFSIFIAKYYTDVFLLSAAQMGTMMFVTRFGDAFIDPVIGAIADRTHTRWGHFRPYLLWMSLPMAAAAVLAFTVPSFGGTAKVVYAYVTLSLMMLAYSAINIPYSGLLGVLTPSSTERTSVCSYRFVMALLPVFIIVNSALPLARHFGGSENSPRGWQVTMALYAALAVVLYLVTFAMTRERVQPQPRAEGSFRSDIQDLKRNRPWLVLCAVGVAALTFSNIRNTVAIYYFQNVVPHGGSYFGPVMTSGALAFIVGVMATSPLSRRFGKRNLYIASMGLAGLLCVAFYFVPPANIPLVWVVQTLISLFAAPTAPLVWAMYADTADFSEWKNGRRATGLVFSAASFAQKFGWAVGGAGTGYLLSFFGYLPDVAESARTVHGILLMSSIIPALGALAAVVALLFYEIDEPTIRTMGEELQHRRDAAAAPPAGSSAHSGGLAPGAAPDAPAPLVLDAAHRAELQQRLQALLSQRMHGVCFSPYAPPQQPGAAIDRQRTAERLRLLRQHAQWVRVFACSGDHEYVVREARSLGLRTLVGAWLGRDDVRSREEFEALVALASDGQVDLAALGNETLLREELDASVLLEYLREFRRRVPDVPVGVVDAYYLFERHAQLVQASDFVAINCYPFWEGMAHDQALQRLRDMVSSTRAHLQGKPLLVAETGWPSQGTPRGRAVPSADAALQYWVDAHAWAAAEGLEMFGFEAFDEPWKARAEGDVGAYWGLWDASDRLKYA